MQKFSIDYIDFARVASKQGAVMEQCSWNTVYKNVCNHVNAHQYLHLSFKISASTNWKMKVAPIVEIACLIFVLTSGFAMEYTIGDKLDV